MFRHFLLSALLSLLAGCATPVADSSETVVRHVRLTETARLFSLAVTPIRLIEDSRCPTGVVCIQAGTVRVEARVSDGRGPRTFILPLGVAVELDGGWAKLIRVCPYPVHGSPIRPNDYLFSVAMTRLDVPQAATSSDCPRG